MSVREWSVFDQNNEMDSLSSSVSELKSFLEEYFVAIEIEQHDEVSQLSYKICRTLVELLDNHVREYGESSALSTIVEDLCHMLRVQGQLAATYNQVIDFVHTRDLVCLGKLHKALPRGDAHRNTQDWLVLNYDKFVRILRASAELLKHLNTRNCLTAGQVWLDKRSIHRLDKIGFSLGQIELGSGSLVVEVEASTTQQIISLANSLEGPLDPSLLRLLRSSFFVTFCKKTLHRSYPIDRFPILVAVWIIANECRHSSLEQLMGELISKIFHQEVNTASLEELRQLNQVGSLWLSHHKRHKVSYKQPNWQNVDLEDYADDLLSDADSSSLSSRSFNGHQQGQMMPEASVVPDLHAKLRQVMDEELLHGRPCPVCRHKSSKLLSCLDSGSCESCALELSSIRLARTNRTVELLDFRTLRKSLPNLKQVVLVSSRQWARHLVRLQANKMRVCEEKGQKRTIIEERVDISDKFERLTVIRNTDGDEDGDDDDKEEQSESFSTASSSVNDEEDQLTSCDSYKLILDAFMERSRSESWPSQWTESVRLVSWMTQSESYKLSQLLPLCTSDLLLMNSSSHGGLQLDLRLSTRSDWSQCGGLWSCQARSSASGLQIGCGQQFDSLELARLDRLGPTSGTKNARCPACGLQLSEIQTLDVGHNRWSH